MEKREEKKPAAVLSGVRVIDFSRLLPGPWCTQLLADLGADVIKVEQPVTGDYSRFNPPNYRQSGVYYNSVNAGKRGISIDLATGAGRQVAHRLIAGADVVIESFRTGVPKKLGIDYDSAKAIRPDVVYCSITGYGQDGPLSRVPGHDLVIQSMSGLMGVALDAQPLPPVPGFQTADYAAAAMAPTAIMAALMRRRQTGEGCFIDLSMYDCLLYMCNIVLTGAMARLAGGTGEPKMEVWGGNPRYSTYLCGDGKPVAVSLLEAHVWRQFCEFIGRPDLVDADEAPEHRHTSHGGRGEVYAEAIAGYCAGMRRDDLLAKMEAAQIPICAVYTPDEALASANVAARGLVEYVDDPREGRIPRLANPLARAGLTTRQIAGAPSIGEHNDAVLAELGYTEAERAALKEEGAIYP